MKFILRYGPMLMITALLTGACIAPLTPVPTEPAGGGDDVGLANPASVNCIEQGGVSQVETRPDGGEYRICVFEDNMQCEEWALLRGNCPAGGVDVSGYATDAARFCAISGGEYTVTGGSGADEEGTCTLPDGTVCDAAAYFDGTCTQE